MNAATNNLTFAAAKNVLIALLEKEAKSDSPFGQEFRAALVARDAKKIERLTEEFADEVVRQYNAKKAHR